MIIVTGSLGLIGSETVRFFAKQGLEVVDIDDAREPADPIEEQREVVVRALEVDRDRRGFVGSAE